MSSAHDVVRCVSSCCVQNVAKEKRIFWKLDFFDARRFFLVTTKSMEVKDRESTELQNDDETKKKEWFGKTAHGKRNQSRGQNFGGW